MRRSILTLTFAALLASLAGFGCRSTAQSRKQRLDTGPAELTSETIDYVDSDAFDQVFESALITRKGVITVRTGNVKPDWTGRLNGWVAAWNMGKTPERGIFRGQFPAPSIDGDTLREFRLLVTAVVDRAEGAAASSVQWWKEERLRQRRVDLLKPYNLRFHVHTDGTIHLIFFNGDHARHYQQFLTRLMDSEDEERWSRSIEISQCKRYRELADALRSEGSRAGP